MPGTGVRQEPLGRVGIAGPWLLVASHEGTTQPEGWRGEAHTCQAQAGLPTLQKLPWPSHGASGRGRALSNVKLYTHRAPRGLLCTSRPVGCAPPSGAGVGVQARSPDLRLAAVWGRELAVPRAPCAGEKP